MINSTISVENSNNEPQCQHFVTRKKRLCRMTVRPGRLYCGEHDPQLPTEDGKTDKRIPCPNDPKHTCYVSKLEKHLTICNARQSELPPYVVMNINAPAAVETSIRKPLSEISKEKLMLLIDKVNFLYDKHIKDNITTAPERPIHSAVLEEFNESDRTESSLRHLRQASRLLWLAEDEGLVQDRTCYVELGAGKGQMSYYAGVAWCEGDSRVLVVDRASLRHKRDNRLQARCERLRADLAHLALARVPLVARSDALLGLAKHLCGVATDYALRCLTASETAASCRGVVLATCCHHRCERNAYIANAQLQKLGINGEEMNAMLGIVSWATCGDGRARDSRKQAQLPSTEHKVNSDASTKNNSNIDEDLGINQRRERAPSNAQLHTTEKKSGIDYFNSETASTKEHANVGQDVRVREQVLSQESREQVGRKAKALLDWGRVLYLRDEGFDARLCYYVPASVSLENVCIVAKKSMQL